MLQTLSKPGTTFEVSGYPGPFLELTFTVVLMGPEQPLDVLADQMTGVDWDVIGVGYGVRGSRLENVTIRFAGK